jgi:hypothetical protein
MIFVLKISKSKKSVEISVKMKISVVYFLIQCYNSKKSKLFYVDENDILEHHIFSYLEILLDSFYYLNSIECNIKVIYKWGRPFT